MGRIRQEGQPRVTCELCGYRLGLAMGVLLAVWSGLSLVSASADGPFQVGLYIQFEDGSTFSQCVALEEVEATRLEVLRQTGIDLTFEAGGFLGTAICKIGETGCDYPEQDCFCQCLGNPCQYWTYWYAEDGGWKLSPFGASSRSVRSGGVEGWVWGYGKESPPLELLTEGICPAPLTATPDIGEGQVSDPTPLPTHTPTASVIKPTSAEAEPEAQSPSPTPQISFPTATSTSTWLPTPSAGTSAKAGPPTFVWLVAGLSGLGIVLLGVTYFLTSRRP